MSTQDPDATLPAQGYGADATAPVTQQVPQYGGTGGGPPGGGSPGGGGEEESDPRRLWFIAGGVLVVGLLIGAVIAFAAGGDDKKESATTTSSSSTTTSSTVTSTSTSSTSTTTTAAGPQILQLVGVPSPVNCPGNGDDVNLTLTWATANTTGVTISIDGPGVFGSYGPTDSKQFPFVCPATSHTYLLTANGQNGQKIQQQIVVQGIVPPTTTTSTTGP